jgi:hypothetical protein
LQQKREWILMYDWYEKAAAQLDGELEREEITLKEYRSLMRDLQSEYDDLLRSQCTDEE